jgi:putative hydroxymethylpyrimidine transport system substrate-binding protein
MGKVAASLAAVIAALTLWACGDGAEPGAPQGATLVLDFTPNGAHAGIYTALDDGLYSGDGVDLEVREPSASSDAPKLLEAGRAQFAIFDIHDLAIARKEGFDVVGVAPIVQAPLAAVIAGDRGEIQRPRDLEGGTVGVTGLPSDEAVLDSVLEADGADPGAVERVTIGFEAVPALAAGRVDAATAFWNVEGLALRRRGVQTREFRVDDFGAPRYPELVLVTTRELIETDPEVVDAVVDATVEGYEIAVQTPSAAFNSLVSLNPDLVPGEMAAQLHALRPALRPAGELDAEALEAWAKWDAEHGIVDEPPDVGEAFDPTFVE